MRYGLISDIHSNLEALQAVLDSISKDKISEYLCVGDIVGYGADPGPCIRVVKSLECKALIAGNHDWGVLGLLGLEWFNEYAKDAAVWTTSVLNQDELDYLKSFKLTYEAKKFTLVHGSLEIPEEFHYILNGEDAYFTMKLMKTPICFVGHSHVAGIFYSDNSKVRYTTEPRIKIDYHRKYVINIGSIGQPRDGNPRASYVIYDDEDDTIEIKRVAYDIKSAQEKILKAGLPNWLASRLARGM